MFGAAVLVVGSLQCVTDRQFQHLSVSAEQWLPLVEVSVKSLIAFCICEGVLACSVFVPVSQCNPSVLSSRFSL